LEGIFKLKRPEGAYKDPILGRSPCLAAPIAHHALVDGSYDVFDESCCVFPIRQVSIMSQLLKPFLAPKTAALDQRSWENLLLKVGYFRTNPPLLY